MAKKKKNVKKNPQRKQIKEKRRREKRKRLALSAQAKPKASVEEMVDYALALLEEGHFNRGDRILEQLKEGFADHSQVCFGLGVSAVYGRRFEEAARWFERAVELSPDFVEAHYNLGAAYMEQTKIHETIKAFRNVVKIGDPKDVTVKKAHDILARIDESLRKFEGIGLDVFLAGLGHFDTGFNHMENGNWQEAIVEFEKALEYKSNSPQAYGNIGICQASLGRRQLALDAFDEALKLDPEYELALVNRKMTETLKEGECLNREVKSVEYYREYAMRNRSYIKELAESQGLLGPGKE